MRRRHALAFIPFVLLWPLIAHGAVTAWTDVTVRIYDTNGVIAGTNRAALDMAGKMLSAASIDVIWRVCANTRHAGAEAPALRATPVAAPCSTPMAPGELAIRIVRSTVPEGFHGALPLGDALIDTRAGTGVLATIYLDRVFWLASEVGVDSQALLGRAIAHELGHLLLATNAHGPVGLMRAFWSHQEVRRGWGRDWTLAPADVAAIRDHTLRRAAGSAWGTR